MQARGVIEEYRSVGMHNRGVRREQYDRMWKKAAWYEQCISVGQLHVARFETTHLDCDAERQYSQTSLKGYCQERGLIQLWRCNIHFYHIEHPTAIEKTRHFLSASVLNLCTHGDAFTRFKCPSLEQSKLRRSLASALAFICSFREIKSLCGLLLHLL